MSFLMVMAMAMELRGMRGKADPAANQQYHQSGPKRTGIKMYTRINKTQ